MNPDAMKKSSRIRMNHPAVSALRQIRHHEKERSPIGIPLSIEMKNVTDDQ